MMAGIVLIVDDNEHLRTIAALTPRSHRYEIVEATTRQEAIEETLTKHPNLILLDIDLPDTRGTEVARAIKRDPSAHDIPIIGWSALGRDFRQTALDTGMAEYFVKPVSPALLLETIAQFIGRS
jgi:two-component system, cell cycle response regulator DivK